MGISGGSDDKASACKVGDLCLSPGLGRSHEEGNGNSLQYSCVENSMDGVQKMKKQKTNKKNTEYIMHSSSKLTETGRLD